MIKDIAAVLPYVAMQQSAENREDNGMQFVEDVVCGQ